MMNFLPILNLLLQHLLLLLLLVLLTLFLLLLTLQCIAAEHTAHFFRSGTCFCPSYSQTVRGVVQVVGVVGWWVVEHRMYLTSPTITGNFHTSSG